MSTDFFLSASIEVFNREREREWVVGTNLDAPVDDSRMDAVMEKDRRRECEDEREREKRILEDEDCKGKDPDGIGRRRYWR